jgi:hypothetical protein
MGRGSDAGSEGVAKRGEHGTAGGAPKPETGARACARHVPSAPDLVAFQRVRSAPATMAGLSTDADVLVDRDHEQSVSEAEAKAGDDFMVASDHDGALAFKTPVRPVRRGSRASYAELASSHAPPSLHVDTHSLDGPATSLDEVLPTDGMPARPPPAPTT